MNEPKPINKLLEEQGIKAPGITSMPKDFEQVELNAEELKLAIFNARVEKYWQKKKYDAEMAIIEEKRMAKQPFTAKELQEYVLKTNPWFELDKQAKDVFELLSLYFTGDKEFENRGFSLSKGICISGDVGVGKTEILNIFRKNKRKCFHMVTVYDIEDMLQRQGLESVQYFYGYVPGWDNHKSNFYQSNINWAIDEVGRESIQFDFGNKVDAISKILQYRYFKKMPFSSLHITTNKSPGELESRYGDALRSRMREIFNYINYTGTDRRK